MGPVLKSYLTNSVNMSIKVTQNDFKRKIKDFGTFMVPLQKMSKNMGDLGKQIVAEGFEIVAQSPINRPIWSHCLQTCKIWAY